MAEGGGVSVGMGTAVSRGVAVSVGMAVAVCVAVAVKVETKLLVGVGVGPNSPTIREPREQPRLPSSNMDSNSVIEAVLRLMICPSHINSSS